MSRVRRALFISFAQNYGVLVLQFAASIFIARVLTPGEMGIFSVATVMVGIVHNVRDFGVANYVIQEKELTQDRIRSALGIAILVAWLLAAAMVLLSGPIAEFYREPGVRNVMLVLALNFMLLPFGSVTMAMLGRELNYWPIALSKVASSVVSTAAVVILALLGFSYMSMAWASVAAILTTIVIALIYRPATLPYLPSLKQARRVLSFGTMSTSVSVITEGAKGAPDLIMGRVINMESVALFGRASGLIDMFDRVVMNAVWNVALPYFSQQSREAGDVKGQFLKSVAFLTAIAWPFFILLAIMAYPVIRILFGPQWDASVPLSRYLCVAAFITAPFLLFSSILFGIGRMREALPAIVGVAILQVCAVFVAASWGVEVVAASFIPIALMKSAVAYLLLRNTLGFNFREFAGAMKHSAGVALFVAVPPMAVVVFMPPDSQHLWSPLMLGALGAFAGWIVGLFVFRHPLREELLTVLRKITKWRGR